jgi:Mg2+ and Co2+ transporter CorA
MLVNCVVYREGKRSAEIPKEEISDYLAQPGTFVWVAIKDPQPGELEAMEEEFDLHPLAVEDARHGHQRPKIEEYGNQVFCVLRTVQMKGEEIQCGEVDIFVGPNFVLSVRHDTEPGFQAVRDRRGERARAPEARRRFRVLRADGQRRGPLFPGGRRAGDRAREDRGRHLRGRGRRERARRRSRRSTSCGTVA